VGTSETSYRLLLNQRGRYQFGPLAGSTRFPIGLIRRCIGMGEEQSVVVFPRTGYLSPRWRQVLQASFRGERHSQVRPGGAQGEFHRLREWRSGDSLRWIHWRTTARRGMPIVREFELPGEPNCALLLDLVPSQALADLRGESVETSISFAATVIRELCQEGGARWLSLACEADAGQMVAGPASRHLMHEMLHALAVAEPHPENQLAARMPALLSRLEVDTQLLVVTSRGSAVAECLAASASGAHQMRLVEQAKVIDVSSAEFAEMFRLDVPAADAAPNDAAADEEALIS